MSRYSVLTVGKYTVDAAEFFPGIPLVTLLHVEEFGWNRAYRVWASVNVVLAENGNGAMLLDTGYGSRISGDTLSNYGPDHVTRNLKAQGITPKEVKTIVCSNSDIHHYGGLVRMNRKGNMEPVFRRAKVYVPDDYSNGHDASILYEVASVTHATELLCGIQMLPTDMGLFILTHVGGEVIAIPGHLAPSWTHLTLGTCPMYRGFDIEEVRGRQEELLRNAENHGWLLVFTHGREASSGYVRRTRDGWVLRKVS